MSMPTIDLPIIDRGTAVSNIVASIALEEAGMAHLMNAEGMKIQNAIAKPDVTISELTNLDQSVASVAEGAADIESSLKNKLELIIPWIEYPADEETGARSTGGVQ